MIEKVYEKQQNPMLPSLMEWVPGKKTFRYSFIIAGISP